jgi:hypothetical protein
MTNKLYCTFIEENEIDNFIHYISSNYTVLYNKMFVLGSKNKDHDKTLVTYNIDAANIRENSFFEDTINVHRKKETNTLYTINALNSVIIHEHGRINPNYQIQWGNYKNCLLLSKQDELIIIPTFIKKIVDI